MKLMFLLIWGIFSSIIIPTEIIFAQDCFESSIMSPTPFMGNSGEIFKLNDGSVWEVKFEYEYLYAYYPTVIVCPNRGKMIIEEKSLNVRLISKAKQKGDISKQSPKSKNSWEVFEETSLSGTISGTVQTGNIFKTLSGSIYEITGVTIQVVVLVQPSVLVLSNGDDYKLVVEGFDEPVICRKLK